MEGLTARAWRTVHHKYFPGADKYYTPFLSVTADYTFRDRELRELLPVEPGYAIVPQLLTKNAEDFLRGAHELFAMGFTEVNLNLGCPSGTVVAKGKGSGMLRDVEALDAFLEAIFARVEGRVSVKTRLGIDSPAEFERLLAVYEKYPIHELTIHARTRKEMYKGSVHRDVYALAEQSGKLPLCYNGDLFTPGEVAAFGAEHPSAGAVMLGRGLIGDPALIRRCRGGSAATREELRAYHDELLVTYHEGMRSLWNAMLHMKEHWVGLMGLFEDDGRCRKRIARAKNAADYLSAVETVFGTLSMKEEKAK
ncbi:MAG: tRNA-dihydrouridine synthase family protein [Oscillospiraceae bacterium]|nr:tRNA-dihydrouridine synthase family protein [Oscillospiraceae bacterium]